MVVVSSDTVAKASFVAGVSAEVAGASFAVGPGLTLFAAAAVKKRL